MKSFLIILFIITIKVFARKDCIHKYIGNNLSTVCVCNSSYCDELPVVVKPTDVRDGVVAVVYETNLLGDRFKESVINKNINSVRNESQRIGVKSQTISIDSSLEYQKIYGFGGAFTDTTGMLLDSVPKPLATAIINSYFSKTGLEYSFGRVPIGGTDYSVRPYTYDDIEDDKQLTHFFLQKEDFQWKIPYIKLAKNISAHHIKLIGSPWSPPAWMKSINDIQAFANLKGEIGGQYYQIWANYLIKYYNENKSSKIKSYRDNGLEFWGITVQNEPVQDHFINSLNMTSEQQRDFIKLNLGPLLAKAGFDRSKLKLMIFDDNAPYLKEWVDIILTDMTAAKFISGIAMHWYYNQIQGPFPDLLLDYVYQNYPEFFLLNTEACSLTGAGHGNWTYAENYAFDIIRNINHWMTGWIEWNMALDMNGGPTWMIKHGCGGPIYVDTVAGEAYKQPTFYALAHFSKLIPPESVRIAHQLESEITDLSVLTVKRPDNSSVVVVLNTSDDEIYLNIKDSLSNRFSHKISSHSIQSYIW